MLRFVLGVIIIAILGLGGYFFMNYQFESHYENGKFSYMKIIPRTGRQDGAVPDVVTTEPQPQAQTKPAIRIATFNLSGLDEAKLSNLRISDVLIKLLPRFDLIALEGLRGRNQGVLLKLVEQMNTYSGRQYNFATDPKQQRDGVEHYSAFVFDRTILEIDRHTLHFVEDPLGRFRHKPLVGAFRVRGIDPALAFTFTLIAVETDPTKAGTELELLADVFQAVRNDGRDEDDIIMLGDFQADENHFGRLGKMFGITAAVSNIPTTTRGTQLVDNIIFDRRASAEFTGRAEVVDMMREFDLTVEQAGAISEHLPLWAEFSSYEGGQRGYVQPVQTPQGGR